MDEGLEKVRQAAYILKHFFARPVFKQSSILTNTTNRLIYSINQ